MPRDFEPRILSKPWRGGHQAKLCPSGGAIDRVGNCFVIDHHGESPVPSCLPRTKAEHRSRVPLLLHARASPSTGTTIGPNRMKPPGRTLKSSACRRARDERVEVAAVHGWLFVRIAITIRGALTYRFEPECVIASRSRSKGGVRASKEDDPREGRGLVQTGQRTVFLARRHYATDFDLVTSEKPYMRGDGQPEVLLTRTVARGGCPS